MTGRSPTRPDVCEICGERPSLGGEQVEICAACLLRLASAATHPERLTTAERELLSMAHGDVVMLIEIVHFSSAGRSSTRLGWQLIPGGALS